MFQFFKETYFTAFTIFFRAGVSWTPGYNAGKGIAGVTLIQFALLLGIASWIDVLVGIRFLLNVPKWAAAIAFITLCFVNRHMLIVRGCGVQFEGEFTHFPKAKKNLLLARAVAMMVIAVAFFICSASVHRHFIGVDEP